MPGHHDAANEYTSLEEAEIAAFFAIEQGLPGSNFNFSFSNFIIFLKFLS